MAHIKFEGTFVYCENHMKQIRKWAKCGVLRVKAGGITVH